MSLSKQLSNKQILYSIFNLLDANIIDVLPNIWQEGENQVYYPDVTKTWCMKLAKRGEDPRQTNEDDPDPIQWELIPVELLRPDYDDFDRAMKDAKRIAEGKNTLTESEFEAKERGGRKITKNKKYDSDEADESSLEDHSDERKDSDKTSHRKKGNKDKGGKKQSVPPLQPMEFPELPDCFSAKSTGTENRKPSSGKTVSAESTSIEKTKLTLAKTDSAKPTSIENKTAKTDSGKKNTSSLRNSLKYFGSHGDKASAGDELIEKETQATKQQCKIKKGKIHHCVFKDGEPTMNSMAAALCSISREIESMKFTNKRNQESVTNKLDELQKTLDQNADTTICEEDSGDIISENLKDAPFKTLEEFKEFDEKLVDITFKNIMVKHFQKKAETETLLASAARGVVRLVIHKELLNHFTWKGLAPIDTTNGHKEAFSKTTFKDVVYDACRRKWKKQFQWDKHIKSTISTMFTQSKTLTAKKRKHSSPSRDADSPEEVI